MNIKNLSFTLAEVLITLAIIGVVASLTIPSVIRYFEVKKTITQVASVYSILSNAFNKMIFENGTINKYGNNDSAQIKKIGELLPKYLSIQKVCPPATPNDCMGPYTNRLKSNAVNNIPQKNNSYTYVLKNGMTISIMKAPNGGWCIQTTKMDQRCFSDDRRYQTYYGSYMHACADLLVDINGKKGPNKNDVDLFAFKIMKDGILPAGGPKESVWTDSFDQCIGSRSYGRGYCTMWLLQNQNMDYLKCPTQLGWGTNKKKKCN